MFLEEFWNGNFQRGDSLYDKTVKYYGSKLPFTWDNTGYSPEDVGTMRWETKVLYHRGQLKDALYEKFLLFKKRKIGKFAIRYNGGNYIRKITRNYVIYCESITRAKVFRSREEAIIYGRTRIPNIEVHAQIEEIK